MKTILIGRNWVEFPNIHNSVLIRGNYNDFHPSVRIGENTVLSGWTFLARGVKIGMDCRLGNYTEINSDAILGNKVNFQPHCVINSNTKIGNNIMFGSNVVTADELYLNPDTENVIRTPCIIEDGVRVGFFGRLISCKIGKNSIIGSGTEVYEDIPPNEVWKGFPAKKIMSRKEFDQKEKEYQQKFLTEKGFGVK